MKNSTFTIKAVRIFLLIGANLFISVSCSDFFEKDLEGKEVIVISPADLLETQYTTQNFWWEEQEGALTYNLQIASPSFNNIEKLLIDTNVSVNKFAFTLYPGKFQWRVRPANGSSKGNYVTRSIEIDTTLDLRGQEIVLKYPLNEFATKIDFVKFSWNKLYNAEDYRFELKYDSWEGSRVISPVLTMSDTISVMYLNEGTYFWGVQAQNNGSATLYSTRKFFVDQTIPKAPVLTEPVDSTTITSWPKTLKWTSSTDNGSALHDSVVMATDKSFKTGSIKISQRVDGQSQTVNLNDNGKYYWKVYTVDEARNVSPSSEVNLLIVGPGN